MLLGTGCEPAIDVTEVAYGSKFKAPNSFFKSNFTIINNVTVQILIY